MVNSESDNTPEPFISDESIESFDESQEDDDDKIKKRERRSKEDNYERNYICGCGKSYLSYAALYTHAKTKHQGVFPEGTTTLHKKRHGNIIRRLGFRKYNS